jgi:hypothetical protein
VQHSPQNIVFGQSDIGQSEVEASNRTAIHFIVFTVPTVYLDDGGFIAMGIGVRSRSAECLGPISGESLNMLWVEAMAERVGHDLVRHYPLVPSGSKTSQTIATTRCLIDRLHAFLIMVIITN